MTNNVGCVETNIRCIRQSVCGINCFQSLIYTTKPTSTLLHEKLLSLSQLHRGLPTLNTPYQCIQDTLM